MTFVQTQVLRLVSLEGSQESYMVSIQLCPPYVMWYTYSKTSSLVKLVRLSKSKN